MASLAIVALQAALGRVCFLTDWQASLEGTGDAPPLIQGWIETLIFWPLPMWAFALLYAAVFIYAVWLWRLVPPRARF